MHRMNVSLLHKTNDWRLSWLQLFIWSCLYSVFFIYKYSQFKRHWFVLWNIRTYSRDHIIIWAGLAPPPGGGWCRGIGTCAAPPSPGPGCRHARARPGPWSPPRPRPPWRSRRRRCRWEAWRGEGPPCPGPSLREGDATPGCQNETSAAAGRKPRTPTPGIKLYWTSVLGTSVVY